MFPIRQELSTKLAPKMGKVFLFALLCVTFAYCQLGEGYIVVPTAEQKSWIEDQAKDLLNRLIATIQDAINSAIKQITDAWDNVQYTGDIIDYIKKQFSNIVSTADNIIAQWVEKAKQAGVDVQSCYLTQEQEIEKLPEAAMQAAMVCIDNEIAGGQKIYDDFLKFIDDTKANFTNLNLGDKFKKCADSSFWEIVPCFTGLIGEMTDLLLNVPKSIISQVDNVKSYMAGMQDRLKTCGTEQINKLQDNVVTIVNSVVSCINDTINNAPTALPQDNVVLYVLN